MSSRYLIVIVSVSLTTAGCIASVEDSRGEIGPEQFVFTALSQPDAGAFGLLETFERLDPNADIDEVDHVIEVETPLGPVSVFTYLDRHDGDPMRCTTVASSYITQTGCSPADHAVDLGPIVVQPGTQTSGWLTSAIQTDSAITLIFGTADDGTTYQVIPSEGWGIMVWPEARGDLNLRGFDSTGELVGETATFTFAP